MITDGCAPASAAVLVPVKAFATAKVRLAPALPPAERAALARVMGARVLGAAGSLPAFVACDDEEVASWARSLGAGVIWTPGLGLNGAVQAGVERLGAQGIEQVIVAHADLPMAAGLDALLGPAVTLVPDRRDDGTNVVCVPAGCGFVFQYGPGSFTRHRAEARRLGLPVRIVREPRLTWDVDLPADLAVVPTS